MTRTPDAALRDVPPGLSALDVDDRGIAYAESASERAEALPCVSSPADLADLGNGQLALAMRLAHRLSVATLAFCVAVVVALGAEKVVGPSHAGGVVALVENTNAITKSLAGDNPCRAMGVDLLELAPNKYTGDTVSLGVLARCPFPALIGFSDVLPKSVLERHPHIDSGHVTVHTMNRGWPT